jgi:choline dehydrogenase-like flavoprotein
MLEGIAGPPDHLAISAPRSGAAQREIMLAAERTSQFGVMVSDTSRGTVRDVRGRLLIRYDLNDADAATVKRGLEHLVDIYWAAGAREVIVPVAGVPTLRDGETAPLRDARVRPGHLTLMAFHPLGTARAGADPASSVVDPHGTLHGLPGIHVADGSAVPTSLGVNPQITIMALSTRLAHHLLGAPAPDHEPRPEHIARPRITVAHV